MDFGGVVVWSAVVLLCGMYICLLMSLVKTTALFQDVHLFLQQTFTDELVSHAPWVAVETSRKRGTSTPHSRTLTGFCRPILTLDRLITIHSVLSFTWELVWVAKLLRPWHWVTLRQFCIGPQDLYSFCKVVNNISHRGLCHSNVIKYKTPEVKLGER